MHSLLNFTSLHLSLRLRLFFSLWKTQTLLECIVGKRPDREKDFPGHVASTWTSQGIPQVDRDRCLEEDGWGNTDIQGRAQYSPLAQPLTSKISDNKRRKKILIVFYSGSYCKILAESKSNSTNGIHLAKDLLDQMKFSTSTDQISITAFKTGTMTLLLHKITKIYPMQSDIKMIFKAQKRQAQPEHTFIESTDQSNCSSIFANSSVSSASFLVALF